MQAPYRPLAAQLTGRSITMATACLSTLLAAGAGSSLSSVRTRTRTRTRMNLVVSTDSMMQGAKSRASRRTLCTRRRPSLRGSTTAIAAAGSTPSYVVMPRYFVLEDQPTYQIRLLDGHKAVRMEFASGGREPEALAALNAYVNGENATGETLKVREPVVVAYMPDDTGMVDIWVGEDPPPPSNSELQVVDKPGQVLVATPLASDAPSTREELLAVLKEDQIGGRRNINTKGMHELAYFGSLDIENASTTELRMPIKLTLS